MNRQIEEVGVDSAMGWFREKKDLRDFSFQESELNQLGYRLLYEFKKTEYAIELFGLNVQKFPKSSNVYDSRGEAHMKSGDYGPAVKDYEKAIVLSEKKLFHHLGFLASKSYAATKLPNDDKKLFVAKGNWANEIAFVFVQGGPDIQLNIDTKDALHMMPNSGELLKVYPFQSQMLNPEILVADPVLTPSQSAFENAVSVEILDKTLTYLRQKGKKIFLIGHSYGASICLEYLSTKVNQAEKVVLMGLDLNEDISSWDSLKSGEYIRWKNGKIPYATEVFWWIPDDFPKKGSFNGVADNLTSLVRSNMKKNYLEVLREEDFDNIVSVYAENDEANGCKSREEIDFLISKKVTVVGIKGNHHSMMNVHFMENLYHHLIYGKSME
ncbi:MAG: hypothetical protein AB3N16_13935 [Flavobacteriaceae bacterium]